MSVYELHLGSWSRDAQGRHLNYRDIAGPLVAHVARLGFTHVEFMPLMEHPYDPSWGYQVTGYFAPTSRFGSPDDLRALIDALHGADIGVIVDWVPAHFPRDDHGLATFDGSAQYEHPDPMLGEHPDWGTLIFDYSKPEVRSFLLASAMYWVESFHVDGIRVDAVASMLYLDYSRGEGQWRPNRLGGHHNLEAIGFLQTFNRIVRTCYPEVITFAEESTAFPRVTGPTPQLDAGHDDGLGFTFKWNMGWMHDTLGYLQRAPVHRPWHHGEFILPSSYAHSERFVLPLSHDEVVHGKGSLLRKIGGASVDRFAQLRLLLGAQWLSQGKKLLFMGAELGQESEWSHDDALPWDQRSDPKRAGMQAWLAALNGLYRRSPALHASDHSAEGLAWVLTDDSDRSVFAWRRRHQREVLAVVLNASSERWRGFVLPVEPAGGWQLVLRSDDVAFGAESMEPAPERMTSGQHGDIDEGILFNLPPYAVWVLRWCGA